MGKYGCRRTRTINMFCAIWGFLRMEMYVSPNVHNICTSIHINLQASPQTVKNPQNGRIGRTRDKKVCPDITKATDAILIIFIMYVSDHFDGLFYSCSMTNKPLYFIFTMRIFVNLFVMITLPIVRFCGTTLVLFL